MNEATHSNIHKAYQAIRDLQPTSPNATPSTKQSFKDTTDQLHQYAGLMHFHLSAIRAASGLDSHYKFNSPEPPHSKPQITPAAQYEQVMQFEDEGTFSAKELVQFLLDPSHKTLLEAEQQGFIRLVHGYSPAESVDEMATFLQSSQHDEDFDNLTTRCINIETNADATARLHARESILLAIDTNNHLSRFVYSILASIHAIRFSHEWNDLSSSKSWKTEYRTRAFEAHHQDFLATDYTQTEYNKKKKTFTSHHEKVIKARNNLRKMFVQFHTAVLLNPTWTPTSSYANGTTGRSPSFPPTLEFFLTNMNPMEDYILEENQITFKQLVNALVPESTRAYIFQFLVDYSGI